MSTNFWYWLKAFNLFRLLENETLEMLREMQVCNSMQEKRKSTQKFGGAKVCKAEQEREYFANPETENEVFY